MVGRFVQATIMAAALLLCVGMARAETALPATDDGGTAVLAAHVLSPADVRRYREIFRDERGGRFVAARRLIAELSDRSLMGYVLAEHYLSPHSGRTPAAELNRWLREYGDLSIAERIRDLSERRTRRKSRVPAAPPLHWRGGGYEDEEAPSPPLASEAARAVEPEIAAAIRNDRPGDAAALLKTLAADSTAAPSDVARLTEHVAASYVAEGMDAEAYALADATDSNTRAVAPMLDWCAGLSAYRLGHYDDAARHFTALAETGSVPGYTRAAAAFWAARSDLRMGRPQPVVSLLLAAARQQPSFYGLIAARLLGQSDDSKFREPVLDRTHFSDLIQVPAVHRAVALWQVGEKDDVANEMNRAFASIGPDDGAAFAALARVLVLPNLELRISETEAAHGVMLTSLFPVPLYAPEDGYKLDPSLVLAIARVESRFRAHAVSAAGARGLMQLMPGTARHLAGRRISDDALEDPSTNLALGQRYLRRLLDRVNGNLFELAAAYNAGPANLSRWLGDTAGSKDDPLLFVESVPSPETRAYIKRFMMYHWLYCRRLQQNAPTLDETASGKWPTYHPQSVPVASVPAAVQSFDAASN